MGKTKIFDGMNDNEQKSIFECFSVITRHFLAGERVITYSERLNSVCVVLSGKVRVYSIDCDGNCSLLEFLGKDEVFGEVFHFPVEGLEYIAEADENCDIMFINYEHIIHPCQRACLKHTQLINNLFAMTAEKMQMLELRIDILTQKNMRQKLLAYLEYASRGAKNKEFSAGMSITELAAYLSVDRSSLMREIRRMKDDGILWSEGRRFRLSERK